MAGGHSGDDIEKGRANSNKLVARLLYELLPYGLVLNRFDGGNLRNAIPREAFAVFGVPAETAGDVCERCRAFAVEIVEEFKYTEPNLQMTLNKIEGVEWVLDPVTMQSLVGALVGLPNGVLAMSHAVEGLVETSSNLASVKFGAEGIVVTTSQRSSMESAKRYAAQTVEAVLRLSGAEVAHSDGYPGWSPDPDSYLLHVTEQCYERLFAVKPKVRAIHAGLECGLFLEKYPELDMVVVRPDAARRAFARRAAGNRHRAEVLGSALRRGGESLSVGDLKKRGASLSDAPLFFPVGAVPCRPLFAGSGRAARRSTVCRPACCRRPSCRRWRSTCGFS